MSVKEAKEKTDGVESGWRAQLTTHPLEVVTVCAAACCTGQFFMQLLLKGPS